MFDTEEYSSDSLLESALERAPDDIDTRQGSIFYDAIFAVVDMFAKHYSDIGVLYDASKLSTAEGEALDAKAEDFAMTRKPPVAARYKLALGGEDIPDVGDRFFADELYFSFGIGTDGAYYLEAEKSGAGGNVIVAGTPAVPIDSVILKSASFGDLLIAGVDEESDDNFRERIYEKIQAPADNGNKAHYKQWCESIDGVGCARVYPLWNGENTVKAVLFDGNGNPCSQEVVDAVQSYIDPATKGLITVVGGRTYTVGDGTGDGVANIGAHFTATAAERLSIDVSFYAELEDGYTIEDARAEAEQKLADYIKDIVLGTDSKNRFVIRATAIGSIIHRLESVLDYSGLKINGDNINICPREDEAPVLGEVLCYEA